MIDKKQMKVSIVILNWNGQKLLENFLPALVESVEDMQDVEIVVADNFSKDQSVPFLREKYAGKVRVIMLEKNFGFAGGYNVALKMIESQYYVLLNSDVKVEKNWLRILLQYMDENQTVAACQPKILSYKQPNYFEYAGAAGGFIDKDGFPFCRGRIFDVVEEDKGQYDTIKDVFWASGACLMIRSEEFWNAGAFDDSFFAHMEEIDLCWRLNSRGKRVVCNPNSVVYHVGGASMGKEDPQKTFLNYRNNLLMLYKNLPQKDLKKTLDRRFYLDNMAASMMMVKMKVKHLRAISDARTEFRTIQTQYAEKRRENILKSVTSSSNLIYPNSIIVEYYLKRNKKFSDLSATDKILQVIEEPKQSEEESLS